MASRNKLQLLGIGPKLFSISAIFHENTKLFSYLPVPKGGVIEINKDRLRRISQAFKTYPHCKVKVELPKEFDESEACIESVIQRRRSIREFSGDALALEELAKLLYFCYGITGVLQSEVPLPLRAAPSGGALYPLEVYPAVFNVEGLDSGIYHYNVKSHQLELLQLGSFEQSLCECMMGQRMVLKASAVFLITAMFDRNLWKYRERGYRYTLFDAGHLAENLYLMATAMNLGCCAVAGFLDDAINHLLDIDGVHESTLYIIVMGKPKQQ